MKIYIDNDFKCHVTDDGTMRSVGTEFFDGKCDAFVEGYRLVPHGESWTREDGEVFEGEMIAPWKDYNVLAAYQEQFEADQAAADGGGEAYQAELEAAYMEGVNSI